MPRTRRKLIKPARRLKLRLTPSELIRFLSKIAVKKKHWLWKGYKDENGYGQFKLRGKSYWAHRVAYAVFVRTLPDFVEVDHRCRETSCVNPWHLQSKSKTANSSSSGRAPHDVVDEADLPF
jgi:hypothetical protein